MWIGGFGNFRNRSILGENKSRGGQDMTAIQTSIKPEELVEQLRDWRSYRLSRACPVSVRETHISWVFLVGDYAYKVKKPIATDFLDYQTLESRKRFCEEEVRLDRRFADDLYLDVVPIALDRTKVQVEGRGTPIEYAVKMRRFPEDALLVDRLAARNVSTQEVKDLANQIADFHTTAAVCDSFEPYGSADRVLSDATDNFWELHRIDLGESMKVIDDLEAWTHGYFANLENRFKARWVRGFIRECHGDLHSGNIAYFHGRFVPFDGIEFNESLRWIDVINDAAFLVMDFDAHDRTDLGSVLLNTYLENTGDYEAIRLLKFYLVYRALVRAKVAMIRSRQRDPNQRERQEDLDECVKQIDQAERLSKSTSPTLWITHGVSGSGKTTISESFIQKHGAIRLRSDLERKRHYGLSPTDRPTECQKSELYSPSATQATYQCLEKLTAEILNAGSSVIVDAAFLKREQRSRFEHLAKQFQVPFCIIDCDVDESELRQRIARRLADNSDASDADFDVLERQLRTRERLNDQECRSALRADRIE
ncbi:Zeta toxin [Novipirellula aureliae]|uniref:Zeta toxin n=2 Tax=Novipirellula aureliae TaxID=2527966 RepID=A0A5C6E6L3_9BACT|nr:Zeta toxin [Novipirellula aureliae]